MKPQHTPEKGENERHPTPIFKDTPIKRPIGRSMLDEDLHKACEYKDVRFIRKVLEIRTIERSSINQMKDYYTFLAFIFDGLKDICPNDLFAIIKKSLYNCKFVDACGSLLLMTVRKGYSEILECLLNYLKEEGCGKLNLYLTCTDENDQTVLTNVILGENKKNTELDTTTDVDYKKCMEILMIYNEYLHIDAKDFTGNTALHYAAQNNWTLDLDGKLDHTFIKTLIKNGASINMKNNAGICVVDRIPVSIIEEFLNECIKEPTDKNKEDYALTMDFKFIPDNNESVFIRTLQNSESHQALLYHPLITTYLHIRWQQVKTIAYLNLAVNVLFFLLTSFYLLYVKKDLIQVGFMDEKIEKIFEKFERNITLNVIILKTAITVIGSLLLIREIIELTIFKMKYLQNLDNCLQVVILVLTYCMLYSKIGYQQSIMAWLLVFSTIEFFLILEKMHLLKMSLYISMIRKITYNYVKLFAFMLYPVIAFGISFYFSVNIQLEDIKTKKMESKETQINNGRAEELATDITDTLNQNGTKFADTLVEAVLKTIIMSTGEFDYSDLDFQHPSSKLIFLVFVFLVFLVGLNLLNGLAISDIQAILKDASKFQVSYQVECIICFDYLKPVFSWICCFNKWIKLHSFEYCFPDKVLTMYPNRDSAAGRTPQVRCQVHITEKWFNYRPRNLKINSEVSCESQNTSVGCLHQSQPVCDCGHKYLVQKEYVKSAIKIMEKMKRKEKKSELEYLLRNRDLTDMEMIAFNVMMQYLN